MAGPTTGAPLPTGAPAPWWRRGIGALLRLRFLGFQRHRYRRLVLERVGDLELVVLPEVFNPALFRTGPFFVESLSRAVDPGAGRVLELGTGTGVGAVSLARRGSRVLATDVSAAAVRCARINCLLHGVEDRVEVREGDLFEPVAGERFATIVFHPPFWSGAPSDRRDGAFRAGDLAPRLAWGLDEHLEPGGRALLLLSTEGRAPGYLERLTEAGFTSETVESRDLGNEVLTLHRVCRAGEALRS